MTCGSSDEDTCACEDCEDCENEVAAPGDQCETCSYVPDLEDAFSKFGHCDGAGCRIITWDVVGAIEDCGPYDCGGNEASPWYEEKHDWRRGWGCHNCAVITRIVRTDTGATVYPPPGYRIGGYDRRSVRSVLPDDIRQAIVAAIE